jgi:hypothetical protein
VILSWRNGLEEIYTNIYIGTVDRNIKFGELKPHTARLVKKQGDSRFEKVSKVRLN